MSRENNIHVAYGFHVNLYHSYRGDTPDGLGFGSDIRIIRKTIAVLNDLNRAGIPVKGTWDTENFFSLEKILPGFAPDIIEGMKQRVRDYGDENIIMGYNNGALGAMTEEELEASVSLAVTNPAGSGLRDIFGECEMLVRPQEVMFTPSQVRVYNRLGVKALCLYHSCVPFDAFQTIIPPLPDEQAFNPLTYTYNGDEITVIPTYSNADVCDAGCLRAWVKGLRKKQESGEINMDLLLFINMDADAIFWETMNLPLVGHRIANTDGIHGLVTEIADLPYIVFDTPGNYIKTHAPAGRIEFTQDTADGNFTGYASWAEKPYNRKIWTAIERNRALARVNAQRAADSVSFHDRILLLSTTHFGLATPVLNIKREEKADELAERIVTEERNALPTADGIRLYNLTASALQCVQLKKADVGQNFYSITSDDLEDYFVTEGPDGSVFAMLKFSSIKPSYDLTITPCKAEKRSGNRADELTLTAGKLTFFFDHHSGIKKVVYNDKTIGDGSFLESFITYKNRKYKFSLLGAHPIETSGEGTTIRLCGSIHLPGEITAGSFVYDFFTVPFAEGVFVRMTVSYPLTPETDSLSTENSTLGRYTDNNWTEAVPFGITPLGGVNENVIKRNFEGDVSSFRVASFGECNPKNKTLDSFNHQLTGGFTGLYGEKAGLILAVQRQTLNSMAVCPMRINEDCSVSMNPFGTYFGKQRNHRSRSECETLNAYTLIAAQGKSIGPAYNGATETALMGFFGFEGERPTQQQLDEICSFSDGCVVTAEVGSALLPFTDDNIRTTPPKPDGETGIKLKNPALSGLKGNAGKYVKYGAKALYHIIKEQIKAK